MTRTKGALHGLVTESGVGKDADDSDEGAGDGRAVHGHTLPPSGVAIDGYTL